MKYFRISEEIKDIDSYVFFRLCCMSRLCAEMVMLLENSCRTKKPVQVGVTDTGNISIGEPGRT